MHTKSVYKFFWRENNGLIEFSCIYGYYIVLRYLYQLAIGVCCVSVFERQKSCYVEFGCLYAYYIVLHMKPFLRFLSHMMNAMISSCRSFFKKLMIFTEFHAILVILGLLCPYIEVFNLGFYLWICINISLHPIFIQLLLSAAQLPLNMLCSILYFTLFIQPRNGSSSVALPTWTFCIMSMSCISSVFW